MSDTQIAAEVQAPAARLDLSKPKYDQSTYLNRAKHFFLLTNPLNLFATEAQLERARRIVHAYRRNGSGGDADGGDDDADTLEANRLSADELWQTKYLYDSAYHPDTGDKMFLLGRMSAQVPMNTLVTGGMLTFYRTAPAIFFWQWFNQTFNALVNYTNRSGDSPIPNEQLVTSYLLATGGALTTALSLNRLTKKLNPLVGRLVPLVAVAAANCINIPLMRRAELQNGIALVDDSQQPLGVQSQKAATEGISAVVLSRITMAMPGMVITPVVVQALTNRGFFTRYPRATVPMQMGLVGATLILSTPLGCSCFSQMASIDVKRLEPEVREALQRTRPDVEVAWYNKGL